MKTILTIGLAASIIATHATAEIKDCLSVEADLDRLACYDIELGRSITTQDFSPTGNWRASSETSAMTDQTNVYLSVVANEDVTCGFGGTDARPTLHVRCRENTTSVYISTSCHLTSSNYDTYGDITYRLDSSPAKTRRFSASSNNQALGLWRGNKAIPFIKNMLGHERILMRFTPYSENTKTVTFDIAGLDGNIGPLRESCHW